MFKRFKYITPVIWLLSWVSLLADIASELLYPILPVYLTSIGYSFLYIGLIEGFADATAGLTKGYFGKLSDKMQQRVIFIRAGYGLSTVAKLMIAITQNFVGIFFARFTDRLGKGVRTAARDALLASETTTEKLASVFGFHRAMDTFGAMLGPVIALMLLHFYPGQYQLILLIAVIPAVLTLALTFVLKRDKPKEKIYIAEKTKTGFFSYLSYWKEATGNYRTLVIALLMFALVNSADVFLLLRIKAMGFSDVQMISCYIVFNLIYSLLSFPIGIIADRIGRKTILSIGFVMFIITYLGFSMADTMLQFYLLFAVYSVFAACNESVAKALLAAQSKKDERATALGFYESGKSIAVLIASAWTGLLWTAGFPETAFYISAGITVFVLFFVMTFDKIKTNN